MSKAGKKCESAKHQLIKTMWVKRAQRLVAMGFCAGLAACATVHSTNLDDIERSNIRTGGLIYHLPMTLIDVKLTPWYYKTDDKPNHKGGVQYLSLEIEGEENIPDPQGGSFVLQYAPDPFSTDRICAAVSKTGLLQSVETATDNKLPEIAISLARLAGRLSGSSPFAAANDEESPGSGNLIKDPKKAIEVTINPLSERDLNSLNQIVQRTFVGYIPTDMKDYKFNINVPFADSLADDKRETCPAGSVCYRTAMQLPVEIENQDSGEREVDYATVINQKILGNVKIERALFVEKITKLGFNEGVLTSMAIKKPSEALEAAKLPLSIVDAVTTAALSAPSQAVGTAVGGLTGTERTKLIEEMKTNTANLKTLQDDLRELRDDGIAADQTTNDAFKLKCTGVSGTD